ncbi:unnamed protein product [marine sediment metagenome]|uniref:Uncharacterized protein n=1 Tax=marine sediment metagenome TaxID=412755 RepID=X1KWN3_9ZZZZ
MSDRPSMFEYGKYLDGWLCDGGREDNITTRCWTSEAELFIERGNLPRAIQSLVRATETSSRPDARLYLVDAISFLQEAERCAGIDEAAERENLTSARQSIGRFKLKPDLAKSLGRISLPVFVKSGQRELYRLFKTFGTLDYETICGTLDISKSTAKVLLEDLLEQGAIVKEPVEAGKKAVFHLPR